MIFLLLSDRIGSSSRHDSSLEITFRTSALAFSESNSHIGTARLTGQATRNVISERIRPEMSGVPVVT